MENLSKREKDKQIHEKEIINAAERIFRQKGYEDAGMDEIAKEAQFTKRTVYQYFESKEELYFAVTLKGYQLLLSELKKVSQKERTGYEKLELTCRQFHRFSCENPETYRQICFWGYIQKKTSAENKRKNNLIQMHAHLTSTFIEMIEEGKADSSIQPDADSKKTACSLVFLMTGFFQQLSASEVDLKQMVTLDREEFSFYTIDLVIRSLKKSKVTVARKGTA